MKFIADLSTLSSTFKSLCKSYSHYRWAVAWAGNPDAFDLAKILERNQKKIDKIVIGLHFYQTHPDFIEKFMANEKFRFYMQSDGTFHAKVYLFYNSNNDWAAIVGSSNFTYHGFHQNEEANILFTSDDNGADFSAISNLVSSIWDKGGYFSSKDLGTYRKTFVFQSRKHSSLKHMKSVSGHAISSSLDVMTWDEYFRTITTMDFDNFKARICLLKKAQSLFRSKASFNSFSPDIKRALAGFISNTEELDTPDVDWKLFGSMQGAGVFKHSVISSNDIGEALDLIPIKGKITKNKFQAYCSAFKNWDNPIACATRLLAIKRPDFFVCINSKNKKALGRLLDMPQSHFTLENYWDIILPRIHGAEWYNDTASIAQGIEKDIKHFQVAMLDSISYSKDNAES